MNRRQFLISSGAVAVSASMPVLPAVPVAAPVHVTITLDDGPIQEMIAEIRQALAICTRHRLTAPADAATVERARAQAMEEAAELWPCLRPMLSPFTIAGDSLQSPYLQGIDYRTLSCLSSAASETNLVELPSHEPERL